MQRPVMNPGYLDDLPIGETDGSRQSPSRAWWVLLRLIGRTLRALVALLLSRPFACRVTTNEVRDETGSPVGRFIRGLAYRLAFLPVFAAVLAGLLVYFGTHPNVPPIVKDPTTFGFYYDTVSSASSDGRRLEGWLVPVLDAKKVVEQRDLALRAKSPAVVLVHDYGQTRQSLLPLVRPLHEAGYVVLLTTLRGPMDGYAGHTFGLKESDDVTAAVELLRRRSFIDASRIAVIGVGDGGVAAMLAAANDPAGVQSVIAIRPPASLDEPFFRAIVPPRLAIIGPLCQWTFEIAYGVNLNAAAMELPAVREKASTMVLHHAGSLDDRRLADRLLEHLDAHTPIAQSAASLN